MLQLFQRIISCCKMGAVSAGEDGFLALGFAFVLPSLLLFCVCAGPCCLHECRRRERSGAELTAGLSTVFISFSTAGPLCNTLVAVGCVYAPIPGCGGLPVACSNAHT